MDEKLIQCFKDKRAAERHIWSGGSGVDTTITTYSNGKTMRSYGGDHYGFHAARALENARSTLRFRQRKRKVHMKLIWQSILMAAGITILVAAAFFYLSIFI